MKNQSVTGKFLKKVRRFQLNPFFYFYALEKLFQFKKKKICRFWIGFIFSSVELKIEIHPSILRPHFHSGNVVRCGGEAA